MAVSSEIIVGRYVKLKPVDKDDAEYTLAVRQDPQFTKYLPRVNNNIEQQKQWIESQRKKEGDYFFVVINNNNEKIGTIGVYGTDTIHPESGRLALKGNAYENFEAALLMYDFAFDSLKLETIYGEVYSDNIKAIRFNKQFGVEHIGTQINDNGIEVIEVKITKDRYNKYKEVIQRKIRL